MANYQELKIWQKARELVLVVYILTNRFPSTEQFGLTSQIRRAVVSISSNIAEGWARKSTKDFLRFLYIALGSLAELETQIILGQDLGYITSSQSSDFNAKSGEVGKLIQATTITLQERSLTPNP